MKTSITFLLALTLSLSFSLHAQVMTTFAGTPGVSGFSGDGGTARNALFNEPFFISMDVKGNLYIADCNNNRIRKVNTAGIITTYAGNGTVGFSGDGGPATAAAFNSIGGIATDQNGYLYIADGLNSRIRVVDTMGIINTYAGNGTVGYSGDGGPATSAAILPVYLSVDYSGNIYFTNGARIRKVDTSGIISTIAGNGTTGSYSGDGGPAIDAEIDYVDGITVDEIGNVYISEETFSYIRKIDTSGIISSFAGTPSYLPGYSGDGGPATAAKMYEPSGLAFDKNGNFYICDHNNQLIREITPSGIISTIAGTYTAPGYGGDGGPATDAKLSYPTSVTIDSGGNIYIMDNGNSCVRKVIIDGVAAVNSISTTAQAIDIFPNPISANNILHINNVLSASSYQLFSVVGNIIQQATLQPGNNTIPINELPTAIYLLQITDSDGQKTITKIIKQ